MQHQGNGFSEGFDLAHTDASVAVVAVGRGPVSIAATSVAMNQTTHLAPGEARRLAGLLDQAADACERARRDEDDVGEGD